MITPLHDFIVVEMPPENTTANERVVQLLATKDKVTYSKVIAAGPGKVSEGGESIPMDYGVGDIVFYPSDCRDTAGKTTLSDGTDALIIVQPQVLCYIPAGTIPADEYEIEA